MYKMKIMINIVTILLNFKSIFSLFALGVSYKFYVTLIKDFTFQHFSISAHLVIICIWPQNNLC